MGRQTALSFAKAQAARIVLVGRREASLKETASLIASSSPGVEAVVRAADTTDFEALKKIATDVGGWSTLIIASVHASAVSTLSSTDIDEWWQGFEVCSSLRQVLFPQKLLPLTLARVDQCEGPAIGHQGLPANSQRSRLGSFGSDKPDHGFPDSYGSRYVGIQRFQDSSDQGHGVSGCGTAECLLCHSPPRHLRYSRSREKRYEAGSGPLGPMYVHCLVSSQSMC